jgi:hypothetical protein
MAGPKPRLLSDLDVTSERVTLRVNGTPMEAIRVKMGASLVWRIKFPDHRLSEQVFANAERAVRWMAAGMPVDAGDERDDPAKPSPDVLDRARRKIKGKAPPPEDEEPVPEWLPLSWESRTRKPPPPPTDVNWSPVAWEHREEKLPNNKLAAVPGAPMLLDPALMARGRLGTAAAAAPPPAAAAIPARAPPPPAPPTQAPPTPTGAAAPTRTPQTASAAAPATPALRAAVPTAIAPAAPARENLAAKPAAAAVAPGKRPADPSASADPPVRPAG